MSKFLLSIVFLLFTSNSLARVLVHGHRGARAIYPENSLVAFEYALNEGVDVLELDLAMTKDNILVVNHEPTISFERCTHPKRKASGKPILINSLNFSEVQEFECGSKPHPRFPKQIRVKNLRIPSLQQVFDLSLSWQKKNKKGIEFNIETKLVPRFPDASPSPQKFAEALNKIILNNKLSKQVIVQSFDYRSLVAIKKLNPLLRTSFLNYESLPEYLSVAKSINADILSPNLDWITKEDVDKLHKANVQVAPWTANTEDEWNYLTQIGVDAIITDDPKSLIDYLKREKLR